MTKFKHKRLFKRIKRNNKSNFQKDCNIYGAYNSQQMYEIQCGLEAGVDVSIYADPKYDFSQMCEIRKGLEAGVDVSIYADPKYSFDQMSEILEGLKLNLDVSKYADPRFDWCQMRMIRDGLETGLDVSKYADTKYHFFQMQDIYIRLKNESKYIGISEDRLHHIIGVARKAYQIAKEMLYTEDFCRKMFMIGWVHDVGYEFSKNEAEHARVSSDLLHQLVCCNHPDDTQISLRTNYAIYYHGSCPDESLSHNLEWKIINMADMLIDSKGNEVTVYQRLDDIKDRYGEHSDQYITACDICYRIGLLTEAN